MISVFARSMIQPTILLMALVLAAPAASANTRLGTLNMHGNIYPASCLPKEQQILKTSLYASKLPDVGTAWRSINHLLCASENKKNIRTAEVLISNVVSISGVQTGDEPSVEIAPRSESLIRYLMAGGQAWNAMLAFEPDKIVLRYFENEACVQERTWEYRNSAWLVNGAGEACD